MHNRGQFNLNKIGKKLTFREGLKFLAPYMKKNMKMVFLAFFFILGGSIFSVFGPLVLREMTALLYKPAIDTTEVIKIGFLLIGMYFGSATAVYISSFITTGITQKAAYNMRKDISAKINRLPLSYFDTTSFGDILSRITNDVDTLGSNLTTLMNQTIQALFIASGILFILAIESWQIMLISILSIPIIMLFMYIIIKISQKYFMEAQRLLGVINGHIEEAYSGQRIIKVFNQEETNLAIFGEINDKLETIAWKSQFFSSLIMPIIFFMSNIRYVLVICIGALIGFLPNDILMFIQYTRQFSQPIEQIGQSVTQMQTCLAVCNRIQEFLTEKEMEEENPKHVLNKENVSGKIDFINVKFGYTQEREIIHDFNCSVQPGQKIAIVGPTGAGKTTLVNLLMRFYELNSGDILIDGISTKEISRENVSELFGMVLQDTWLFQGTIEENLRYGKEDATLADIKASAKACYVSHFINSLPGGYNYMLEENANISQGQKQLLTITRAMIQNAPMLILDEATSSVDTRTEIKIQKAMEKLTKGRTSFVIAHRLSTIKNSDLILVMKDGDIIEQGRHAELLSQNGFYKELYYSQFAEN